MNILIIGGTSFVGRHIVEAAIHNKHRVTLFNRGLSNPNAFPSLRNITGDRKKDANKLKGKKWDAVIDTCAYSPADIIPILENVETEHYTFISTISVYAEYTNGPPEETSKVLDIKSVSHIENGKSYGILKANAEKLLIEALDDRVLIVRPSIVAGPYDPTDRFTFWVKKLEESGESLIPGGKTRKVQWIDARDLAIFVIKQVENKTSGIFNVAADSVDMETFVNGLKRSKSHEVWVNDAFLMQQGIKPFEIPLWIPVSIDHPEGFITVQNEKAKKAGLKCRSVSETGQDIREWWRMEREGSLNAGLTREKELELLTLNQSYNEDGKAEGNA